MESFTKLRALKSKQCLRILVEILPVLLLLMRRLIRENNNHPETSSVASGKFGFGSGAQGSLASSPWPKPGETRAFAHVPLPLPRYQ